MRRGRARAHEQDFHDGALHRADFTDRIRRTLNNEAAANEGRSLCLECATRPRADSPGDIIFDRYPIAAQRPHRFARDRLSDYFPIGFIRKWNRRSPRQVDD